MDLSKDLHPQVPKWAAKLFLLLSVVLIPWTIYLSASLPKHHLSNHWDITWVGLDSAIIAMLVLSGVLVLRKSKYLVLSATAAASLLLVDGWFDVLSERRTLQVVESVSLAILVEIPLAVICFTVALKVLTHPNKT